VRSSQQLTIAAIVAEISCTPDLNLLNDLGSRTSIDLNILASYT